MLANSRILNTQRQNKLVSISISTFLLFIVPHVPDSTQAAAAVQTLIAIYFAWEWQINSNRDLFSIHVPSCRCRIRAIRAQRCEEENSSRYSINNSGMCSMPLYCTALALKDFESAYPTRYTAQKREDGKIVQSIARKFALPSHRMSVCASARAQLICQHLVSATAAPLSIAYFHEILNGDSAAHTVPRYISVHETRQREHKLCSNISNVAKNYDWRIVETKIFNFSAAGNFSSSIRCKCRRWVSIRMTRRPLNEENGSFHFCLRNRNSDFCNEHASIIAIQKHICKNGCDAQAHRYKQMIHFPTFPLIGPQQK